MNLKQDVLNHLGNEKYYNEVEVVRVANDPNMPYKEKVDRLSFLMGDLARIDLSLQLVGKYFQEPAQQQPVANAPEQPKEPVAKAHPGQSHGE